MSGLDEGVGKEFREIKEGLVERKLGKALEYNRQLSGGFDPSSHRNLKDFNDNV